MKLIQTQEYLLLIDEEAEMKHCNPINICHAHKSKPCDKCHRIEGIPVLGHYPLTKEAKELDLPLLPNPFEEVDFKNIVEDLPEHDDLKSTDGTYSSFHYQSEAMIKGYELGYKAAQSKQFSLEDMIAFGKKCFYKGFDKSENDDSNCYTAWREENSGLVQSLSTQQLPSEFIPDYQRVRDWDSRDVNGDYNSKLVLKTTTNSEGKEILVGTYKY